MFDGMTSQESNLVDGDFGRDAVMLGEHGLRSGTDAQGLSVEGLGRKVRH
jgi:hypothetical protein